MRCLACLAGRIGAVTAYPNITVGRPTPDRATVRG